MEEGLFDANEWRYRQACECPMNTPPLVLDFGFLGTGPAAQEVFRGTYVPPPGTDPYAARFLKALEKEPSVLDSTRKPPVISNKVYWNVWKDTKEHTSAHDDGYHYGMGKTGCSSVKITTFEAIMNNIPMTTGYSPPSFRRATDVMLQKKVGIILAKKLRIIKLFNTQFNINNKVLAHHMIQQTEEMKQFPEEQAGSRKRMRANLQGLNKTLTFDLIRQRRQPAALCSNDAQACYDWISHTAASLAMQSIGGLPAPPLICMFTTLQNLENSVRTAYGDSETTYGGDIWIVPMQGIGQGNGIGPATWAVVSTPLLKILKQEGHGLCYHTALTKDKIHIVGYAFVDDVDLIESTRNDTDTWVEVAKRMQDALTLWEGVLSATGGALVPDKSFWYLVGFKWSSSGNHSYIPKEDLTAVLKVKNSHGIIEDLELLGPDEARRTLGIYLAPLGTMETQVKVLRENP